MVGEKSWQEPPKAYIYQYPSLTLEQTLEHGTEQAYSAAAFNQAGDRLATVGSYPDYMLTVWDWRSGCTLLRSKAFSQEVYRVSFCPYADGALTTSGMTVAQRACQVRRQAILGRCYTTAELLHTACRMMRTDVCSSAYDGRSRPRLVVVSAMLRLYLSSVATCLTVAVRIDGWMCVLYGARSAAWVDSCSQVSTYQQWLCPDDLLRALCRPCNDVLAHCAPHGKLSDCKSAPCSTHYT